PRRHVRQRQRDLQRALADGRVMIAELISATTDIAAAVLAAPVPAHAGVRLGLVGIAALLFVACLLAAHAPHVSKPRARGLEGGTRERKKFGDRGGFR